MTWLDDDKPFDPGRNWPAGTRCVKVLARIRDNSTGEIHESDDTLMLEPGEERPGDFLWSEGNFACDCNRKILWGRYVGVEYEDEEDADGNWTNLTPCGDGGFSVQLVNPADGVALYDEFEEKA
jgi:hypothetical protein